MLEGTIVDATLIAAPPSTKNKDDKRDPEMHQSKKGNDWAMPRIYTHLTNALAVPPEFSIIFVI
jgi:hypothetical protein